MHDWFRACAIVLIAGFLGGASWLMPSSLLVAAQIAPATWTAIPAAGPAARWDHTLAADPKTGRLVLFGGRDANGAPFADTWLYSTADEVWQALPAPGPAARFGQAVTVDPAARALWLFGGQADGATFFNDVWKFDLDALTWTEVPTGEARPSPRYGTSAVLDDQGQLLISHGFTFEGRFDDTWSLDPGTGVWTDVSPAPETRPLKRCLHEAVWDGETGRMLLYGGCSSGFGPCPQGDLWAFDPATGAWSELPTATNPAARSNPALVRDEATSSLWLIAGLTEAGYAADLWSLDLQGAGPAWSEIVPDGIVPEARASHDAAVLDGVVYLFGGYGVNGPLADFWALRSGRE